MLRLRRRKTEMRQQQVDVREAFNLWDILNSKYEIVERLHVWENMCHDADLKVLIQANLRSLNENIGILERELEAYSIAAPDRNPSAVKIMDGSQIIADEAIAQDTFVYLQEHVENLLRAFRTTTTNEAVRAVIQRFVFKTIGDEDRFIRYLKLKGWIETPPLFKHVPPNVGERITTVEAANLWDHLTIRQDHLQLTEVIHRFAHDGDFKATLAMGMKHLSKNLLLLEKEIQFFGIPFPKKPAKVTVSPDDTEIFKDDHMYRTIFTGIQGASVLHAQSLKECTFNDRVRGLFKRLLGEEISYMDTWTTTSSSASSKAGCTPPQSTA